MPPREINPRVSPRTERAILAAIAQHPDDRPATVEAFRASCCSPDEPPTTVPPVGLRRLPSFRETHGLWRDLLAQPRWRCVATVVLLTATALLVTLLSPALP